MFNWSAFTLFLYMLMRMSGFVLFNPFFARRNIPTMFQAGFIGLMSVSMYYMYDGSIAMPGTLVEFMVHLVLELGLGYLVALTMHMFFYIADQGGEVLSTQMGLSMAKSYDPSSQSQLTTMSNLLTILMYLLFLAGNGHLTLLRLMLVSGEIVPFGTVRLGMAVTERVMELFVECALLGVKLCLPILGAELIGQFGMGILMTVIPQINVFSLNIELKVIIGLTVLMFLISPIGQFLLEAEKTMLVEIRQAMALAGG